VNQLTMRSKITVRWTSCPADLGYDGTPTNWRTAPGEIMSVRKAVEFAYALSQRIGQGTYKAIQYTWRGELVERYELEAVLMEREAERFAR